MIAKDCKRLAKVDFPIAEVSRNATWDLPASPQGGYRPTGLLRNRPLRGGRIPGTGGRDRASLLGAPRCFAGQKSREELQLAAGMRNREHFRKAYLEPLLASG